MSNKIITISRQFGSGGRTIARKTAEKLNIPCYDREIIEEIAKHSGFAEDYIKEEGEYTDSTGFFGSLGNFSQYGNSNRITIWTYQCRIIRELAAKGNCVIVGRCADYVLKGEEDLLKVFIYSDMDARAERIVHEYGESDEQPEKRLRNKDKRRAAYYEIYTDQKYGDPMNYDICLNSARVGLERCVDIITDLYLNPAM